MTDLNKVLEEIRAATRPYAGSPSGVPVVFEPSRLGRRLAASANLVIGEGSYDIIGGVAYVPHLSAGLHEAHLTGAGLLAQLEGGVEVANGSGAGRLVEIPRRRVTLSLVAIENGAPRPFVMPVAFLLKSGPGAEPDQIAKPNSRGRVTVMLQPGRPYLVEPAWERLRELGPSWTLADRWAEVQEGAVRRVVQRDYSVILEGPTALAGQVVIARGPGAVTGTFDQDGRAYLPLAPGAWDIEGSRVSLQPAEISVRPGTQTVRVKGGRPKPAGATTAVELTIRIALPRRASFGGSVAVTGPNGREVLLEAQPEIRIPNVPPGKYSVRLVGHPTLDGEAQARVTQDTPVIALRAAPGRRSRWLYSVLDAHDVVLMSRKGPLPITDSEGALRIPHVGRARALFVLPGQDRLFSPELETASNQTLQFTRDADISLPARALLAYRDGWLLETGPGPTRARAGDAVAFAREGRGWSRYGVTLTQGQEVAWTKGARIDRRVIDLLIRPRAR